MLKNIFATAQCLFGAGLAGIGLYGIVEAAVPTEFPGLVMAACTVAAGVNVLVTAAKKWNGSSVQPGL